MYILCNFKIKVGVYAHEFNHIVKEMDIYINIGGSFSGDETTPPAS